MAGSASGVRAGKAFVELSLKNNIQQGLTAASKKLKAFGASITAIGSKVFALGSAAAAAFIPAVVMFAKVGDKLDKMALRTGASVEALSELGHAAEISGTNLDTMEKGLFRLTRNVDLLKSKGAKAPAELQRAFQLLGVSAQELAALTPDQQLERIADSFKNIKDPGEQAAVAFAVFGRAGQQMMPLLKAGGDEIRKLRAEVKGLVTTEDAKKAAELADAWTRLKSVWQAAVVGVGGALADDITDLLNTTRRYVGMIASWIKAHKEVVILAMKVALGVAAFGAALIAVGTTISLIGSALAGLSAVIGFISSAFAIAGTVIGAIGSVIAFLVTPIGLVIVGVTALVGVVLWATGAMGKAWDWIKGKLSQLGAFFGEVFGGIKDSLAAGDISQAAEVMWASFNLVWVKGVNFLKGLWGSFTGWIVGTLSSAWASLLAGAEVIWHGLAVGWIETVGVISKGWNVFVGFFQKSWATMQAWAQKAWNTIKGWFDESANTEQANAAIDAELEKKRTGIDDATNSALSRLENERQAKRNTESATHEGALAAIEKAHQDRLAANEASADQSTKDAESQLNSARARFKKAVADAKAKKEAADGKPNESGKSGSKSLNQQVGAAAADAGSLVRGTFNARALQTVRVTSVEKQLAALERIADNTDALKDADGIEID